MNELSHFGIPGMKWGVRKTSSSNSSGSGKKKSRIKTSVKKFVNKKRKNSVKNMSNEELKARINRMLLEKQYKDLKGGPVKEGKKMVSNVIKETASNALKDLSKNALGYAVNKATGKKILKTRW